MVCTRQYYASGAAHLTMHFQELQHVSACMRALPAVQPPSLTALVLVLRSRLHYCLHARAAVSRYICFS